MIRQKLEHLVTTGKISGRRSRGTQHEKITDCLNNWLGEAPINILHTVGDRAR